MLHRALEQFLTDVHWGEIDVLVVDMPPGTGDVSISLGQLLPRAEVVVVTTPQTLAQDVAARAAAMAQKTNMRLLGVVENMSGDVFGSGGARSSRASSACRCSARCRSTRRCASRATPAQPVVSAARGGLGAGDRRDRAGDRGAAPRAGRHRQVAAARRLSAIGLAAAAFFDLDRTLLRRSSALALAGTFRERGLISR
jgi:hypothetical protein